MSEAWEAREDTASKLKGKYYEQLESTMQCEGVIDILQGAIRIDGDRKGPAPLICGACEMRLDCPVMLRAMHNSLGGSKT